MKAFLECIPCIIRQSIEVSRLLKLPPQKQHQILLEVLKVLRRIPVTHMTPPEATEKVHKVIQSITGEKDLYKEVKKENNQLALKLYPRVKEAVKKSADPVLTALRLSIAGNVIDYGADSFFDIEKTIEEVLTQDLAINHLDHFLKVLEKSKNLLFIGDNAGEIVFDKLLIEELIPKVKVTYAVKSEPTLNDATMEDAKSTQMSTLVKVIESGSECPGTFLPQTTPEFRKIYDQADMVVAKGQGNFETMEDLKDKPIFFLFKVKCQYLAKAIGVKKGDIVLVKNKEGRL